MQFNGQSDWSWERLGNDIMVSDIGSPVLRGMVNVKPSGCFLRNFVLKFPKTEVRSGDIRAKSIASFLVNVVSGKELLSPSDDKYVVTLETSHVVE